MLSNIRESFRAFHDSTAIMLCDENSVLNKLSYRKVEELSQQIRELVLKNIKEENICMALKMKHNIYIPSIIVCLRLLGHGFMFVNEKYLKYEATFKRLGIVWMLTFDDSSENTIDNIDLDENHKLSLVKLNSAIKSTIYSNICYIIKTSGTTDISKIVRVEEYCILDNIKSLQQVFKLGNSDIIYFGTALTFDPAMVELFLSLFCGACLLITPHKTSLNTNHLYITLFTKIPVTFIQIVPSLFLRWSSKQISQIITNSKLKILAFGGEEFPSEILSFQKRDELRIFNLYGITEISCWALICEIKSDDRDISIGEPLGETVIEIRNEAGCPVIEDCEGEIYLGSSRRLCYIDEEFCHNNLPVFRETGDLGVMKHSKIYYRGRKNDIIKRFGLKIKLEAIEEMIYNATKLHNKCVWFKSESKLLTFLIIREFDIGAKSKIIDKIRVKLLHKLPRECFPDYFEVLPRIPVTCHGKIDQKQLEKSYVAQIRKNGAPSSEIFKNLLIKYFGLNSESLEEILKMNFMEIGGNSILAIQFLSEFANLIDCDFPSDLVTLLLENDLNSCLIKLTDLRLKYKRINEDPSNSCKVAVKKIKTDIKLTVNWRYNLDACVDASPLIFEANDKILVAVGSFSHIFVVLDANTGEQVSKFILPDNIESVATLSNCKHYLYIGCFDGKLYCLDFINSKIIWQFSTGDRIKCKATLCGDFITFGSYDKNVYYITKEGTLIWKTFIGEAIKTDILFHEDLCRIFVATIEGSCVCLSQLKGEILWKFKSESPILASGCMLNDSLLFANVTGNILSVDFNGEFRFNYNCGGYLYASLINYKNDCIIFNCYNSRVCLVRCESNRVEMLSEIYLECDDKISTSPAFNDEYIIVSANSGILYLINLKLKAVISQIKLPDETFSSPIMFNNKIYSGCRDNYFYCINIQN